MTMPITRVMRWRFIDPSRPLGQTAVWPARSLSVEGGESQELDGAWASHLAPLSRALVDDAPPPDRVPHVGEGPDVCGRVTLEDDEIGGASDGDPPRAGFGGEAPGRGRGQGRQDIGK